MKTKWINSRLTTLDANGEFVAQPKTTSFVLDEQTKKKVRNEFKKALEK